MKLWGVMAWLVKIITEGKGSSPFLKLRCRLHKNVEKKCSTLIRYGILWNVKILPFHKDLHKNANLPLFLKYNLLLPWYGGFFFEKKKHAACNPICPLKFSINFKGSQKIRSIVHIYLKKMNDNTWIATRFFFWK